MSIDLNLGMLRGRALNKQEADEIISFVGNQIWGNPAVADATTAGKVKTVNAISYRIAGKWLSLAATDNLFDFTGNTDLTANQYVGIIGMANSSGTASVATTAVASTAAAARLLLPALIRDNASAKAVVFTNVIGSTGAHDWDSDAIGDNDVGYENGLADDLCQIDDVS